MTKEQLYLVGIMNGITTISATIIRALHRDKALNKDEIADLFEHLVASSKDDEQIDNDVPRLDHLMLENLVKRLRRDTDGSDDPVVPKGWKPEVIQGGRDHKPVE